MLLGGAGGELATGAGRPPGCGCQGHTPKGRATGLSWQGQVGVGDPAEVQLKVKSEPRNVPEKPLTLGTSLGLKARGESKAQINYPRKAPQVSPASGSESYKPFFAIFPLHSSSRLVAQPQLMTFSTFSSSWWKPKGEVSPETTQHSPRRGHLCSHRGLQNLTDPQVAPDC